MALALDASTPAFASAASTAVTTASFTPPAGALLVAMNMHSASSRTGNRAATLTDSVGLTWTLAGTTPLGPSPAPDGDLSQVWTARVTTSAAMTVTATITSNGIGVSALRVLVFTGASAIEGVTNGGSTGVISQALTTTVNGALPYLANSDYNGWDEHTPAAGTSVDTSHIQGSIFTILKQAAKTPAGSLTIASTAPTSGPRNAWVAFAVDPAPWTNFNTGVAARNGSTSHTIPFGFSSTSGNLLVAVVYGAVTHTAATWTERLSPVSTGELSVFTKTSAGDNSITVTHGAASNYPVGWVVYEFPAGSSYTSGASGNLSGTDTPATLSGLPGTQQLIISALGRVASGSGITSASAVWASSWVEDADQFTGFSSTDGMFLSAGHLLTSATSATPDVTPTYGGGNTPSDRQGVTFAIALGGGGGPATHNADAALAVTATLATAAAASKSAAATLAVTATATAAATGTKPAASGLSVTASLSAAATRTRNAAATLAVTATLAAATGGTTKPAAASLAVTAGLTAAASATKSAAAALSITATITAAPAASGTTAAADLPVTATLSAAATPTRTAASALAVTATIAAGATSSKTPAAALAVTATLAADAIVGAAPVLASAALAVTATLAAVATRSTSGGAILAVTATLAGTGARTALPAAALAVTAGLGADATVGTPPISAAASLAVTASLTAAAIRSTTSGATLSVAAATAAAATRIGLPGSGLSVTVALASGSGGMPAAAAALAIVATIIASASTNGRVTYRPFTGRTQRPFSGTTPRL